MTTSAKPLRRAELNVLRKLALAERPLDILRFPGADHTTLRTTLRGMCDAGLVQRVSGGALALPGYVITDAGRVALGRSIRATESLP